MKKLKLFRKGDFSFSWHDTGITLLILSLATLICFLLKIFDNTTNFASMVYIFAIVLISRFTDGFLYGIVSSVFSVLAVNYAFSYPYFKLNVSIAGYPLTMTCMLIVAMVICTLTTRNKQNNEIRLEIEREKMRANLLRAVSHDLRTPLTSILGSTSAVIDNDDVLSKEERLQLLRETKEDVQWLIGMVENLLSVTRIDGNRNARIIKTEEAVEELAADVMLKFRKRFPDRATEVKVPNELLLVPMDCVLIEQVIMNLLENAVLHGETVKCIRLEVKKIENYVQFEVSDDGVGIREELLPHIFDGHGQENTGQLGDARRNMGIGLSVCATIIKAHGGEMTAFNRKEGGAVFRFTLPCT